MRKVSLILICFLVAIQACKVPPELNTEKSLALPTTFRGDSSSQKGPSNVVAYRNYFKDSLLIALIDTAIRCNLDLQTANQKVFAAQSQFIASRNAFYPGVNAAISTGVNKYGDYTMDGVGNYDTNKSPNINSDQKIPDPVPDYYVGLNTTWEIGLTGRLRNRKKAQVNRYLASVEGKKLIRTQLVAEVARFYYELVTLDAELEIIQSNIQLQEKGLEIVKIQKQSGRINELAVKQFEAQYLRTLAMEVVKKQEILSAENRLNTLVGRFPTRINRKDSLNVQDIPALLHTGVPSELLINRPDVKQAENEFKASVHDLKSVRGSFYPSLTISANVGMNAFKSALWFDPASLVFNIIGGLSAPLINRNAIMNQYRQTYAGKNTAFLNYQKVVLQSVEEVSTELNRFQNYQTVTGLKTRETKAMQEAVSISIELFLTNYANYMEVLIARQNRLQAELQLIEAVKQQFNASIFLYKSLGGGWQ